jgi:hypothetical protein
MKMAERKQSDREEEKGLKKDPNREKEGGGKRKVEWSKRKSRIEKKKVSKIKKQSPTCSIGNGIETKVNESFDNSVFFDIKAKRTCSIVIL